MTEETHEESNGDGNEGKEGALGGGVVGVAAFRQEVGQELTSALPPLILMQVDHRTITT